MRIVSMGHAVFSVTLMGLGIVGLLSRDFVPVWNPVPAGFPARELFMYVGVLVSLIAGIGLLVPRMAASGARLLVTTLLFWLLFFRLPDFVHAPPFQACWSVFPLAVILAAALVLYAWFAADQDHKYLGFISKSNGLRIARILFGVSLIFFG